MTSKIEEANMLSVWLKTSHNANSPQSPALQSQKSLQNLDHIKCACIQLVYFYDFFLFSSASGILTTIFFNLLRSYVYLVLRLHVRTRTWHGFLCLLRDLAIHKGCHPVPVDVARYPTHTQCCGCFLSAWSNDLDRFGSGWGGHWITWWETLPQGPSATSNAWLWQWGRRSWFL